MRTATPSLAAAATTSSSPAKAMTISTVELAMTRWPEGLATTFSTQAPTALTPMALDLKSLLAAPATIHLMSASPIHTT